MKERKVSYHSFQIAKAVRYDEATLAYATKFVEEGLSCSSALRAAIGELYGRKQTRNVQGTATFHIAARRLAARIWPSHLRDRAA